MSSTAIRRTSSKIEYVEKEVPEIGTFGFATPGKGFDKVIDRRKQRV
jgi:hypothetical protein